MLLYRKTGKENRVGEAHDDRAFQRIGRAQNGVRRPQGFILIINASPCAALPRAFQQFPLRLFAETADDERDFFYRFLHRRYDFVYKMRHDGTTRQTNQRFGRGQRVRPHAFAHAGHRNNDFHIVCLYLNLCVVKYPAAFGRRFQLRNRLPSRDKSRSNGLNGPYARNRPRHAPYPIIRTPPSIARARAAPPPSAQCVRPA